MTDGELDFAGQRIIVTGAGSGIGRATAQAFARRGASVLAVGRTPERLTETAEGRAGIHPFAADLTAEAGPAQIVAQAHERLGGIDVLVNNAGVVRPTPLGSVTGQEARRQFETNLVAPILLMQEALPGLERSRGTVVNVSSAIGQRGWPAMSVYAASKAALDSLTRVWAVELGARGVRAVTVAPGPTRTPVLANNGYSAEQAAAAMRTQAQRYEQLPVGRMAEAEEVAWWILAVSDRRRAAQVNGAWLPVDGGGSVS
ncbi:SDR family NAD(P)-dependent oxidoreductase [Actinoalloteichus hymeniacidonis]|uniref:Ketoreductase domain-containing protein n=1 Tax=Actinoalloteichus hymeniacidonis TaxID=340345 RepID=A0AAC9MY85_9PSEU|nr:SDR family oxidoreductase [Actinoalloteichus hymeniacidonis]AOS62626.1 short-chain dehydrogenase of unknown substrate specificity [Actinoalloteichus hymeniacidonis]MBB5909342.1 NAD(P)-dependent dehydrogenase (short-subunit alcohol dehydrogenase family) [Actinoalloteichus hymeniacidonis]